MSQDEVIFDILPPRPTPEALTEGFKAALAELRMTPADLAAHMDKNSDYRDFSATIRSIQRMVAGDTRVSGEMLVIAGMLVRQRRRLKAKYPDLSWKPTVHGGYSAQVENWKVFISPQTKGRWILSCRHGDKGYSPPFGRWLSTLEEAKDKALVCVEEGMNDLAELVEQSEK